MNNEFTVVFCELPSYRDQLIDRWSFDLAKADSQTESEYEWKKKYEEVQLIDDYGEEEVGEEEAQGLPDPNILRMRREVQIKENDSWWDGTIVKVFQKYEEDEPKPVAVEQPAKNKPDPKTTTGKGGKEEEQKQKVVKKTNPKRMITYV